jgi:hypothetical protein
VETPAPNPSDSEDVTTALETAEIFAKKGDATEVAHWLSRAAECARRDGNEVRASEIERAAGALAEPAEPAAAAAAAAAAEPTA